MLRMRIKYIFSLIHLTNDFCVTTKVRYAYRLYFWSVSICKLDFPIAIKKLIEKAAPRFKKKNINATPISVFFSAIAANFLTCAGGGGGKI